MAWDAGAIVGSLGLNLSEYGEGMLQAEGIAQAFPAIVTEFLENPLIAVVEIAKEAAEAVVEAFNEVAGTAAAQSLAAEKAGVTVEQFSRIVAVGKTVGISMEEVSGGFRFLDRNAASAVDGSLPKAAEQFEHVGVSVDFLKSHLGDAGAIFDAVLNGISELPTQAQRTQAAMQLLGRGGEALVPIFDLGKEKIDALADTMAGLGATESKGSAEAGRGFKTLSAEVDAAFEGMKKAAAEPILDYFAEHADEILPLVQDLASELRQGLGAAMQFIGPLLEGGLKTVLGFADALGSVIVPLLKTLSEILTPIAELVESILDGLGTGLQDFASWFTGGTAAAGFSNPQASTAGGTQIDEVHVHVAPIDLDEASSQIAAKIQPGLREALAAQHGQLHAAARHAKVRRAVGGSSSGGGGF